MNPVSFAASVKSPWLTNPLDPRLIKCTAGVVMTQLLLRDATDVVKSLGQEQRKWNIRVDSGMKNVSVVACAKTPSELKVLSPGTTISTALDATKRNLPRAVLSVVRLSRVVV